LFYEDGEKTTLRSQIKDLMN